MKSIRILYHNVLGYNLDRHPVEKRADTMLAIYQKYQPDILCFQEMTTAFRADADSAGLMNWLKENYIENSFERFLYNADTKTIEKETATDDTIPTSIFISKDSGLTVKDAGYIRARKTATKGTAWMILQDASGKAFCVSDSHFVSPTEQGANTDYILMRDYRTADANAWLGQLSEILKDSPQISVISGGDFNTGKKYSEPNAGVLTPWELFVQMGYTDIRGEENNSIDHALCMGNSMTVVTYQVLQGDEDVWGSDHAPHYADIIVN